MQSIAIIDYGMGNIHSVKKVLEACGSSPFVTNEPGAIKKADKLVIPGVGAFGDAMAELRKRGLVEPIQEFAGGHIGIILGCLQDHGPQTIDEIAKRTQLTSVQVARRTSDMHKRGLAGPTGSTRLSASGRNERVWGVMK